MINLLKTQIKLHVRRCTIKIINILKSVKVNLSVVINRIKVNLYVVKKYVIPFLTVILLGYLGWSLINANLEIQHWKSSFKHTLSYNTGKVMSAFLFFGIDEGDHRSRGKSDIIFLVVVHDNEINCISFPRDMLYNIPEKGTWLINSLYTYLGGYGACKVLETRLGISIDKFYAIDLSGVRKLASKLKTMDMYGELSEYSDNYEYIEDWIRHRHKLKFELERQRRIQAFLRQILGSSKRFGFLSSVLQDALSKELLKQANVTDMDEPGWFGLIYNYFRCIKNVNWYIWPGMYQRVKFNYSYYHGDRYMWIPQFEKYSDMIEYSPQGPNPWVYSRTNFFKKEYKTDCADYATTNHSGLSYSNWMKDIK